MAFISYNNDGTTFCFSLSCLTTKRYSFTEPHAENFEPLHWYCVHVQEWCCSSVWTSRKIFICIHISVYNQLIPFSLPVSQSRAGQRLVPWSKTISNAGKLRIHAFMVLKFLFLVVCFLKLKIKLWIFALTYLSYYSHLKCYTIL